MKSMTNSLLKVEAIIQLHYNFIPIDK